MGELLFLKFSTVANVQEEHFAQGLNFYNLFWVFFIGCFMGVVVETLWIFIRKGYIESRVGLVYGLFNLVYGFGALAMMIGLYWLRDKNAILVMLGGVVIGTLVEYASSLVEEYMFGSSSWDYSEMPFNLNGRVNLLYSIFWGILALAWVRYLYPLMEQWINRIPNDIGKPLTWMLLVFMVVNIAVSAMAVKRWSARQNDIPPHTQVGTYFDRHYPDSRMKKIFPNMNFKNSPLQNPQE